MKELEHKISVHETAEHETWIVELGEENLRLDVGLANHFKPYSRTYFQKLIDDGLVIVNGLVERKRYKLVIHDEIEVEFPLEKASHLVPEDIPLDVLFEDEDILVIHKPSSMVVHPGAGNFQGTLANALAYRGLKDPLNPHRPGIVHRLDKDTSGVIVTAKNALVHSLLVEAFASRSIQKTYLAIACKNPVPHEINEPIGRDPTNRQRMAVTADGKPALTYVDTIASFVGEWPLFGLKIDLMTGRTHQIRVHLRSKGSPILGDSVYGWQPWNERYGIKRQMLHAWRLSFDHPVTGKKLAFEAPLPADMALAWKTYFGSLKALEEVSL